MVKIEPTPSLRPQVSMNGLNTPESGPYVCVGFHGREAVYLDRQHVEQLLAALSDQGGLVSTAQHERVVAELADARRREAGYDNDRQACQQERARLEQQVATLTDDVNSARAVTANLMQVNADLKLAADPAEAGRQLLTRSIQHTLQQTAKPARKTAAT